MSANTVLISGLGIAGPMLAFWLRAYGFRPTLVEHARTLRSGGYVIDFWGLGYDIAERMGLSDELNRIGYHIREMRIVNKRGKRIAGLEPPPSATMSLVGLGCVKTQTCYGSLAHERA